MISRNSDSYFLVCVFVVVSWFIPKLCWERDMPRISNHQQPYEPRLFTQVEVAVKAGVFESNMYFTFFIATDLQLRDIHISSASL